MPPFFSAAGIRDSAGLGRLVGGSVRPAAKVYTSQYSSVSARPGKTSATMSFKRTTTMRTHTKHQAGPLRNDDAKAATQATVTQGASVQRAELTQLQRFQHMADAAPRTLQLQRQAAIANDPSADVVQRKRGKETKHNRKTRSAAKHAGLHVDADEYLTARTLGDAVADRDDDDQQTPGLHTSHLADRVFSEGQKVVLAGERHDEVDPDQEGRYFRRFGYGYHTEISSYTNKYTEAADGTLSVKLDKDDFAVENIPLRALSQVLDMIEHKEIFRRDYVIPIKSFVIDCYRITSKMDQLVNPKMLGKLARRLHLLKRNFVQTTFPGLDAKATLFTSSMHAIDGELMHTYGALGGTRHEEEAGRRWLELLQLQQKFEAHLEAIPAFFISADSGNLDPADEIETSDEVEEVIDTEIRLLDEYYAELDAMLLPLRDFLQRAVRAQAPAALQLAGTGVDTDNQVTTGRSEAMLTHARWLARRTSRSGELVKVGDQHITDIRQVAARQNEVRIIAKSDYDRMQDESNTASLRIP